MMAFLAIAGNAVWGQTTEVSLNNWQESAYKVEGDGDFYITGSNSKGIEIARGSKAKITLENVTISISENKAAIEVNGEAQPTVILKGENTINSTGSDVAISVPRDNSTSLTFDATSTGKLIINVPDNNDYAIGNNSTCGDIYFNGGTIQTNGKIGVLRVSKDIEINGNVVLICNDIDAAWGAEQAGDVHYNGGIVFEGNTTGQMYGNVTLNSPLDLTDNDLTDKLNLRGGTLTIGNKNSLKRDATEDVYGGTAVAFVANYNENSPASCSATDAKQDYTLYGTNTEITLQTEYPTCNNNTHQSLGWTKGENPTSVEGATITTDASYPSQTTNNIDLNAAWVEITKTISAEEDKAIPTENNYNKLVVYPSSLNVTFTQTGSTSVNGVTFADGALTGTPAQGTAGKHEYAVKVTCGSKTVDAKMTLDVKDAPQSIENATIELASKDGFTYNGAEQFPIVLKIDGVVVPSDAYTCTWTEETGETVFKNAGSYELTMIEAVENSGYTGYVDNTIIEAVESIVMNPRDLNVSINNQTKQVGEEVNKNVVSQGGEGETTILIDSKTTLRGEQPAFTGNLACAQSTKVPGEYPNVIEQGTMDLNNSGSFLKKNYKLNVTKKGTLTVTTTIDDPEDIELVITDADAKDGKYIYNGVNYIDQDIAVKIKLSDGTSQTIDPKEYGTISWNADEVKNVGTYTASITFDSDIYGSATVTKTIEITPRSLDVNLTEVPTTIPNDVDMDNLESWWSPWDEVT